VATAHQAKGLGTSLIQAGLDKLRSDGTQIAVTYGDPAYYQRFGFRQVSTDQVPAPQPLSHPHGWQAISLAGAALPALSTPVKAAPAFDLPELW